MLLDEYDYETDIVGLSTEIFQGPSAKHWFGTDQTGRDIFARVLYGARYSLAISVGSVAIGLVIGMILLVRGRKQQVWLHGPCAPSLKAVLQNAGMFLLIVACFVQTVFNYL